MVPTFNNIIKHFVIFWPPVLYEFQDGYQNTNAEVIYPLFIKRDSLNKRRIDYLSIKNNAQLA